MQIKVYDRQQLALTVDLTEQPVEIGRQSIDEPPPCRLVHDSRGPRIIIAPVEETTVSRQHARMELQPDGQVRLTNLSAKRPIFLSDGTRLDPGNSRPMSVQTLMTVGEKVVRLERDEGEFGPADAGEESLELLTLSEPTIAPGQQPLNVATMMVDDAFPRQDEVNMETLARWFQGAVTVLQSAADSADFFQRAAQAMVEMIQLDFSAVLV
ncbi:MAG: FHA domain-containing protein, partial [Planctomycetales bacterium]